MQCVCYCLEQVTSEVQLHVVCVCVCVGGGGGGGVMLFSVHAPFPANLC